MALILTITNQPFTNTNQETSFRFENGGTLGRSQNCDWVLHDPSRYISGKHATISQRGGIFYVMDTSTNGVYVNNTLLGKGNSVQLNNGDQIRVGQFEIKAQFDTPQQAAVPPTSAIFEPKQTPSTSGDNLSLMDILEQKVTPGTGQDSTSTKNKKTPFPDDASSLIPKDTTPEIIKPMESTSDHSHVLEQHFEPPPVIPDDWFLSENKQAPESSKDKEKDREKLFPSSESTSPDVNMNIPSQENFTGTPTSPKSGGQQQLSLSDKELLQALFDGMGIHAQDFSEDDMKNFVTTVGQLVRKTVEGMVTILRARTAFKSEFRMDVTTIRSQKNNPLKFSVGTDEAIKHMFFSQTNSYLPPLQSLQEGFQDIQAHQLAMMAGMQAALKEILKQFDPVILEQKFDQQNSHLKLLPSSKKARYWEAYAEYYQQLLIHIQDDFHSYFGKKFVSIYEEQVAKLKSGGKNTL